MQSELSCHIGLHGKLFCWGCCVKGNDGLEGAGRINKDKDTPDISPALSPIASDNEADDSESNFHNSSALSPVSAPNPSVPVGPVLKTKKVKETMEMMLS